MKVAWRIESGGEGVTQVGKGKVALTNMEFKGKCHLCEKYGQKQTNVPRRINQKKKKKERKFQAYSTTAVRRGINLQTAGNMRLIKTRGPRIGRRKKKKKGT